MPKPPDLKRCHEQHQPMDLINDYSVKSRTNDRNMWASVIFFQPPEPSSPASPATKTGGSKGPEHN